MKCLVTYQLRYVTNTTHLVVNTLVEVLNEYVLLTSLAQSRVALRPHNSAWAVLYERVVQVLERSLAVRSVEVVDVGVPEGTAGHGVAADSDTA